MAEIIIILVVLAVLVLVGLLLVRIGSATGVISSLQNQVESIRAANEKLSETLQKSLNSGHENVQKNLKFNAETLGKLGKQLGDLQQSNKQMAQLGTDVRKLHDIFAHPKHRGGFGEWSLENILKTVLPADAFEIQSTFKTGKTVDALIKLPDYSVPVDAKFPLENFKKIIAATNESDATKSRKEFLRDVKKHIDKIAENYIVPEQGTLDFALMYIPAENVYYEMIVDSPNDAGIDISDYARQKKVLPVSPNLLYVYLMTVVMGLRGLEIEATAAEIRKNLEKLSSSFGEFVSNWDTLGTHLRNSGVKYDEGQKKLDRLILQLTQIQNENKNIDSA